MGKRMPIIHYLPSQTLAKDVTSSNNGRTVVDQHENGNNNNNNDNNYGGRRNLSHGRQRQSSRISSAKMTTPTMSSFHYSRQDLPKLHPKRCPTTAMVVGDGSIIEMDTRSQTEWSKSTTNSRRSVSTAWTTQSTSTATTASMSKATLPTMPMTPTTTTTPTMTTGVVQRHYPYTTTTTEIDRDGIGSVEVTRQQFEKMSAGMTMTPKEEGPSLKSSKSSSQSQSTTAKINTYHNRHSKKKIIMVPKICIGGKQVSLGNTNKTKRRNAKGNNKTQVKSNSLSSGHPQRQSNGHATTFLSNRNQQDHSMKKRHPTSCVPKRVKKTLSAWTKRADAGNHPRSTKTTVSGTELKTNRNNLHDHQRTKVQAKHLATNKPRVLPPSPRDTSLIRSTQVLVDHNNDAEDIIEVMDTSSAHQSVPIPTVGMDNRRDDPEFILHVTVLGVTGIVCDPSSVGQQGNMTKSLPSDPSTPAKFNAVVGISLQGGNDVEDVSSVSKPLILSPIDQRLANLTEKTTNSHKQTLGSHARQRLIAVWSTQSTEATPKGSDPSIQMKLSNLAQVDEANPSARYVPVTIDLTIALSDPSSSNGIAVPIGVAKLKVTNEIIRYGNVVAMEIPVLSLDQSKLLSRLACEGGRSRTTDDFGVSTINMDARGQSSVHPQSLDNDRFETLRETYCIDEHGNSVMRVMVQVQRIDHHPLCERNAETLGSLSPRTEGSVQTGKEMKFNDHPEQHSETAENASLINHSRSFDSIDSRLIYVNQTACLHRAQTEQSQTGVVGADLYSPRVSFNPEIVEEDDINSLENSMSSPIPEERPNLRSMVFSSTSPALGSLSPDSRVDRRKKTRPLEERVEQLAGNIFGPSSLVPSTNCRYDDSLDDTFKIEDASTFVEEGESYRAPAVQGQDADEEESLAQSSIAYSNLSHYGLKGLHDAPSRTDAPTATSNDAQEDVKKLVSETAAVVKDFLTDSVGRWAFKRAEEVFPVEPEQCVDHDVLTLNDATSVGDATYEALMKGQLRVRSLGDASGTFNGSIDGQILSLSGSYESMSLYSEQDPNGTQVGKQPTQKHNVPEGQNIDTSKKSKNIKSSKVDPSTCGTTAIDNDGSVAFTRSLTGKYVNEEAYRTVTGTHRSEPESESVKSIVGAIAEVISHYTSCAADIPLEETTSRNESFTDNVPVLIDPDESDMRSIGELTAGTFEKIMDSENSSFHDRSQLAFDNSSSRHSRSRDSTLQEGSRHTTSCHSKENYFGDYEKLLGPGLRFQSPY